jgi:hypothetical protein
MGVFADRLQEISTESASRLERTIQSALGAVGTLGQERSVMEEAMAILKTDFKDEFSREDRLDIMSSFREESNARTLVNLESEGRLFWLQRWSCSDELHSHIGLRRPCRRPSISLSSWRP